MKPIYLLVWYFMIYGMSQPIGPFKTKEDCQRIRADVLDFTKPAPPPLATQCWEG